MGALPDEDSEGKVGTDVLHFFSLESSLTQTVLCLPVDFPKKRILLGMKNQGFGEGKYNGFGGKIEPQEDPEKAALRELLEESSLKAIRAEKVCEFQFFFPHVPEEKKWDQIVHVFLIRDWKGEPKESNEMKPEWFSFEKIPFKSMWQDDSHWLPLVLKGEKLRASFVFGEDGETIKSMEMEEVKEF